MSRQPTLPLAQVILEQLREEIISGRMPPGTSLVEAEIQSRFEVSRNTLREALHLLQREGLATHIRNRGVEVRTLDVDDVTDIFIARRTLEMQALQQCRELSTDDCQQLLKRLTDAYYAYQSADWQLLGTCSLRFHQHLVSLLGSPTLDQLFARILAQLRLIFATAPSEEQFQRPWLERDQQLYDLLESGHFDAAAQALSAYLDDSQRIVKQLLTQQP